MVGVVAAVPEPKLRLKRGPILHFEGKNWKLVSDRQWKESDFIFVPNGGEEFLTIKIINGKRFALFKCLNDTFAAQLEDICKNEKYECQDDID